MVAVLFLFSFSVIAAADETSYDKGIAAYKKKDFKKAVQYLEQYVGQKPDPYAYYLLGYAHYKLKNHAESAAYFKQAYVIDPNLSPQPLK